MEKNIFFTLISLIALLIIISNISCSAAYFSKTEPCLMQKPSDTENVRVIIKFKDNSVQALELKKNSIPILEQNESIEKIYFDYPVKTNLYDSVPLINAQTSWAMTINNYNLTGKGQSICVIDTGINYAHPDLGGCLGEKCKVIGGYDFINSDNDPIDDHGHGTNIAGIAAANGIIKGVAPDARLIAIKVLDSNGQGYSSDVINGMEWCINHSKEYNISSIVLSLSTDCSINPTSCSSSFCSFSSFDSSIAKAAENNIFVLTATGNQGMNNLLPSPACSKNAIPIAASDKQDAFWPNSNRNPIVKIVAPGKDIYSPNIVNGYESMSGTSMAVPHIAGAIAIINQLIATSNYTKTPKELETLLYETGKQVNDPVSHLNFSRPNIKQALFQLDSIPPNIKLNYPKNYWTTRKQEQNFSCTASDWQIKEMTFHLFNISENESFEIYNYSANFSGEFGELNISISNLSLGAYTWRCSAVDNNGNFALSTENNSFFINNLASNLLYPKQNTTVNNETRFYCLAESAGELKQITFFIWNASSNFDNSSNASSNIYNNSLNISGFENISYFDFNFTDEGEYLWNCLAENNESGVFFPINYSITHNRSFINLPIIENKVDAINPAIAINSGGGNGGGGGGRVITKVKLNQTNDNKTNIPNNTLENKTKDISIARQLSSLDEIIYEQPLSPEKSQISSITGAVIEAMNSDSRLKWAVYFIVALFITDILLSIFIKRMKKHIERE